MYSSVIEAAHPYYMSGAAIGDAAVFVREQLPMVLECANRRVFVLLFAVEAIHFYCYNFVSKNPF